MSELSSGEAPTKTLQEHLDFTLTIQHLKMKVIRDTHELGSMTAETFSIEAHYRSDAIKGPHALFSEEPRD